MRSVTRILSGDACLVYKSMLVDNPQPTAVQIFMELRTWFGDEECHQDPIAASYYHCLKTSNIHDHHLRYTRRR